jgi:hypothetical protein
MSRFSKFFTFLAVFFISGSAFGTFILLHQKNGSSPFDFMGRSVAGAGDVDGDGKEDFIVGATRELTGAGSVFVYSGASGQLLYQKDSPDSSSFFGFSVAGAGDVNGDGRADFLVGAFQADPPGGPENAGSVFLYSGADGSLFYRKDGDGFGDEFGISVAGVGDVDGDGKSDFAVGARLADPGGVSNAGSAYLYSGANGQLIHRKNGAFFDNFGFSVAGAGDVDGDGKSDFLVGALHANGQNGAAYLYSGASGTLIFQKDGANSEKFGCSVAGTGDVDGDGTPDFIVGAVYARPDGFSSTGSAYLFSGATGGLLYQKNGLASSDRFGYQVAGAGDVDGDGHSDFIVGAPDANPGARADAGSAYLYSGADGALIFQIDGTAPGDHLGLAVAGTGDLNGNGSDDFIVGAVTADPGGIISAGSALVYSVCASAKGDMNLSGGLSPADVVLMLNCVFLASGSCDLCFADVNCSGGLSSADVVIELNMVFLGAGDGC